MARKRNYVIAIQVESDEELQKIPQDDLIDKIKKEKIPITKLEILAECKRKLAKV